MPTGKRTPAVYWVTGALIVFHLFTQSYLFRVDTSPGASAAAKRTAEEAMVKFQEFLTATAVGPGKLHYHSPAGWYRIVTSSFIHYGWLHLILNAWFFVLFGHVLEHVFGAKKFLAVAAAGLIIPPAMDGFFPVGLSRVDVRFTGGFSGVVYAIMGAYLVCFPNSRAYGAVNYDLKFWAALLFFLVPVTMVTRFAGVALTETVIIMGIVAAFLLIQPEHARISSPVITVMLYKLLQDILLLEPAVRDIFSNSVWRIGGGFAVGLASGFLLNGMSGWKLRWGDETREGARLGNNTRTRMSVARLEAEGHKSAEGARIYLGQRVFVGDAERAIAFYRDVIMPKFPDVVLPVQEQMALARLLHFKGHDVEALHAYEALLKQEPVPEEYSLARLKAAELIIKLAPERSQRARELLDRFERGHITMVRDKVEAQRLRAMLPVVERDYKEPPSLPPGEAAYSVPEDGKALPVVRRRTKSSSADYEAPAAMVATGIEAPRVRPKSFMYVPGAPPISLRDRKLRSDETSTDDLTLSADELLKKHWKPLPAMASGKPLPPTLMDKRIKNARIAQEDDKPTLYVGLDAKGADRRAGGRLSQLELMKLDAPKAHIGEMPGQYGGLHDQPALELAGAPISRIKLKREKESGRLYDEEKPLEKIRRQRSGKSPIVMELGPRIPLSIVPPETIETAEVTYAESLPAEKGSNHGNTWAVLLTDTNEYGLAKNLRSELPVLAEKYGTVDYSEMSGVGFEPLFLYRHLPDDVKSELQDAANRLHLDIRLIPEEEPILALDPVEVLAITVTHDGCTVKTAYGSRRVSWDELTLVSLCDIRLTPNSRSLHRYILELVTSGLTCQRYQLFERTLSVKGSSILGETITDTRHLLERIWEAAASQATKVQRYPTVGQSHPVFESYAWYNEEILRILILK